MPTIGAVCYIRQNGRVLLQLKAKGRFGGGWWNAPGGKLDDGETAEEAVTREVEEETNLSVTGLREHGVLTFYFGETPDPDYIVHVFSTTQFAGEPRDSDEGHLQWFDEAALPYDQMWPDDDIWLPDLLVGRSFRGTFYLTADYKRILSYEYGLVSERDGESGIISA